MDFFSVSLTVSELAKTFKVSNYDITWGIGLVLMLRVVGACIFGIWSDRYGRKWPFITNNILFIVLELGTGFTQTYHQFLGVRALFGIAMGGLYANAIATAIEDCPKEARGLISGIVQQGYAMGYLFATIFARALVNTTSHGWRPLYWFCACPPALMIVWRLFLPETDAYIERTAVRARTESIEKTFYAEMKLSMKRYWLIWCYMSVLLAGLSFMVRTLPNFTSSADARHRRMAHKTCTLHYSGTSTISMQTESPSPRSSQIWALLPAEQSAAMGRRPSVEDLLCSH